MSNLTAEHKRLAWHSPSALVLIAANLVPLMGVMAFGWNIGELFLLYWLESAIIGVFNIARMAVIGGWAALPLCLFFTLHYGGFMAGHLVFLLSFFIDDGSEASPALLVDTLRQLWPAILALVASHGFSFVDNFLRRREYERRRLADQMGEPYARIMVMHVTIIVGGFLALALDTPLGSLLLLIALKIAVDLAAHLKQHRRLMGSAPHSGVGAA